MTQGLEVSEQIFKKLNEKYTIAEAIKLCIHPLKVITALKHAKDNDLHLVCRYHLWIAYQNIFARPVLHI